MKKFIRIAKTLKNRINEIISLSRQLRETNDKDKALVEKNKTSDDYICANIVTNCVESLVHGGFARIATRVDFDGDNTIINFLNMAGVTDYQKGGKEFFNIVTMPEEKTFDALELLLGAHKKNTLQVVRQHFGYLPFLESIQLVRSIPKDGPLSKSQLFHIDYNACDIVKIFVYLTDVTETKHGPLLIIKVSKWIKWLIPSLPVHKSFRVEKLLNLIGHKREILGPCGEIFAVQTSRLFHAGSRVQRNSERIAAIITFRSPSRLRGIDPYKTSYPQQRVMTMYDDILHVEGNRTD